MLSTRIKEDTKKAHQELEKKVVLKMKAIRSTANYANFLNSFYIYFNALEAIIAPYITAQILPDYSERRDSKYLKRDIEELGFEVKLPSKISLPEINSLAEALGAMYVMEGSIMGGPIIVDILKKNGITKGFSFFSGYGAGTGEMWTKFISALNTHASTAIDQQNAISAANHTFSEFQHVFKD